MKKKYIYNTKTHTLHIIGFCCHCKTLSNDPTYIPFVSEDDAVAFAGRGLRMCRLCTKMREKELTKNI